MQLTVWMAGRLSLHLHSFSLKKKATTNKRKSERCSCTHDVSTVRISGTSSSSLVQNRTEMCYTTLTKAGFVMSLLLLCHIPHFLTLPADSENSSRTPGQLIQSRQPIGLQASSCRADFHKVIQQRPYKDHEATLVWRGNVSATKHKNSPRGS